MPVDDVRGEDGALPAYAWPGGYPVLYLTSDGETFCADCANGKNGSMCRTVDGPDDMPGDGWRVDAWFVHYEGPPAFCCHCNAEIPSAYGDPENPDD